MRSSRAGRGMRILALAAILLSTGLAGCSDLVDTAPAGCGEERRHRLVHTDFTAATHAQKRTQGDEVVYLWEIPIANACPNEHADIDLRIAIVDHDACRRPTQVVGSAYLPGSFISARTIPLTAQGDLLAREYTGHDSYGLKQGGAGGSTTYTVDVEVHFEMADDGCGEDVVRDVEIVVVDRVAK